MRINEFHKKPTAKDLNESAGQTFGQKINLDNFSLEQMYDARNKLRTKVHQFENTSNYNAVYEDETYSKNKMFLDVLNRAIEERQALVPEFTQMEQLVLSKVEEGAIAFEDLPEELQEKAKNPYAVGMAQAMKTTGDKPPLKKSTITKAHDIAKSVKKNENASFDGTVITEGEEEKAELIMAARDMVDRITGWMEDTANMQAESMLELVDSIRDEMGADLAMEFESVVKPALATIYTALESSRQSLTQSVSLLTGEGGTEMLGAEEPMDDMGADDAMPGEGDGFAPETDDFAADASAAGGEEAAGRMTRESIEYSRRLATLLAPKKK
jgi:hypothetical protein